MGKQRKRSRVASGTQEDYRGVFLFIDCDPRYPGNVQLCISRNALTDLRRVLAWGGRRFHAKPITPHLVVEKVGRVVAGFKHLPLFRPYRENPSLMGTLLRKPSATELRTLEICLQRLTACTRAFKSDLALARRTSKAGKRNAGKRYCPRIAELINSL